jgi:hypothetical protein
MSLNEDHGLTPEEEAALNLKDEDEEETHVDPEADPEAADEPAAAAEPQADPDPAADPEPAVSAAEPAGAADPEPEAAPAPAPAKAEVAAAPAPILIAQAPEDAQEQLAALAAAKRELSRKYEDGEITSAEKDLQYDALNDQILDVKMAIREAEQAQKMNDQQILNLWIADCNRFLAAHEEYSDPGLQALLDHAIKSIASQPENRGMSNDAALAKAHGMVQEKAQAMVAAMNKQAAPAAKVTQHKVPTPAAPPNIGNLPAASLNDTTGGEFASLNALQKSGDVEAYEAAVEKLTDAQRARYFKN